MKWEQMCLNVHRASKVVGGNIYRYRISDTSSCSILVKEKNGDLIEKTEHETVDEAKRAAERYMNTVIHNK